MNLFTQHHTVLSLERSLSISAVGYLHSSGSVLADSRVKGCTVCAMHSRLSIDHCFSMFQHATHTIVAMDTAWPWASEAYGLCAHNLSAYTYTRKIIRCYSPNWDSYGVLAANKNELAARAFQSYLGLCWCNLLPSLGVCFPHPKRALVASLLLVVRPGAPNSVLAPSSDALCS